MLIRRIKNIVRWIPVLWGDEQYDYGYLLEVMRFKLTLMENFFRSGKTNVTSALETADEIGEARNAVDRLIKNDYHDGAFLEHNIKWGRLSMDDEGGLYYELAITPEQKAQCHAEARAAFEVAAVEEQSDWNRLSLAIKRASRWWD